MALKIILFGQLADITGTDVLDLELVDDTDSLQTRLKETYPALQRTDFRVAVNKNIISGNEPLTDHSVIALLPPFSGG